MIALTFLEIRMTGFGDAPVLLLREAEGTRVLPVWITAGAAASILGAFEGDDPAHPGTHDLMIEALAAVDAVVSHVRFVGEKDGVIETVLMVNDVAVACRASDAVALALRCGARMQVVESVLDKCGLTLDAVRGHAMSSETDAVEEFRAFLQSVNPEDFGDPGHSRHP